MTKVPNMAFLCVLMYPYLNFRSLFKTERTFGIFASDSGSIITKWLYCSFITLLLEITLSELVHMHYTTPVLYRSEFYQNDSIWKIAKAETLIYLSV